MEKRYYTPTIEEFRVGFEYEYDGLGNGNWLECIFEPTEFIDYGSEFTLLSVIKSGEIRVKYLDSEDIESIIHENVNDFHTKFKLRDCNGDELIFQTYWIEENEFLDEEYLYYDLKYSTIKIAHKSKTLFFGTIKNKSELIILLKQLGIQ